MKTPFGARPPLFYQTVTEVRKETPSRASDAFAVGWSGPRLRQRPGFGGGTCAIRFPGQLSLGWRRLPWRRPSSFRRPRLRQAASGWAAEALAAGGTAAAGGAGVGVAPP